MIRIGNLDLGHLINTLNYLATLLLKVRVNSCLSIQYKSLVSLTLIKDESVRIVNISNATPEAAIVNIMLGPLISTPTCEARIPSPAARYENSDSWSCKILTCRLS